MFELSGGRSSLPSMLEAYDKAWQELIAKNNLQAFSEYALPTTISWKVDGKKSLFHNIELLAADTDQVHIGTVNNRFIASILLTKSYFGMRLIKILQRRADSTDPLGLDSIDYLVENINASSEVLTKITGATLQKERNDMHSWLSLRFGMNREFEAKFTDQLVLAIAQKELAQAEKQILQSLGL